MFILDCTLRDGGYYNNWNFPKEVVASYLEAMVAANVEVVELGLRSLKNSGFKGACAYSSDHFISSLNVDPRLKVAVMVNASELCASEKAEDVIEKLFPQPASRSPVDVIRIACHVHEFEDVLPVSKLLKQKGYIVGYNLMQIAALPQSEVENLALAAIEYPLDVLYFADSMGSMDPQQTSNIIAWLRKHWKGDMGIHTHDNMGLALQNTLQAVENGVTWLDSTVTGMGRGPGNSRTEELAIEVSMRNGDKFNIVPLMEIIRKYFQPLKNKCGWGSNPYYYLSGKYGIHPTYIQEMLSDSRYSEEDILAAIDHLKIEGGKKFSHNTLDATQSFYRGKPRGNVDLKELFKGKEVLLLGTGPGVEEHSEVIIRYIEKRKPIVVALNTQSNISQDLIDIRVACHPIRLLADCEVHKKLPQPLMTPKSMLPGDVSEALENKQVFDYGLSLTDGKFVFGTDFCSVPSPLVICYALAAITSGGASKIYMAGFDGYNAEDPRNEEMNKVITQYENSSSSLELISITPTKYQMNSLSIYGLV